MRTRLLCLLLTVCVTWLGMSFLQANEDVHADCQRAGGMFIYQPYQPMRCVVPGHATPAARPREPAGFSTPSLSV